MRPTSVEMLLRTIFRPQNSASVRRLHRTSGLRVTFRDESDRKAFATNFAFAQSRLLRARRTEMTAVFDRPAEAEVAFQRLLDAGVPKRSISLLWRAGQFLKSNFEYPPGHSKWSVVAASAGGGLAGAIFGMTMLTLPGLGLITVGGALAAQSLGTIGAVGGAFGATGGALARMLSDIDVADRDVPYFEMAIGEGKVFLTVDPRDVPADIPVSRILLDCGGHLAEAPAGDRPGANARA